MPLLSKWRNPPEGALLDYKVFPKLGLNSHSKILSSLPSIFERVFIME